MKKTIKFSLFLVFIFSLLFLYSCPDSSTDMTAINISFGTDSIQGKAAVSIGDLVHIIKLSGPTGTQIHTITGAGSFKAVVVPGLWKIDVEGYLGVELYSEGSESIEVEAGRTSNVSIHMDVVWTGLAGGGGGGTGGTVITTVSLSVGFDSGTDPAKGFNDALPSTLSLGYEATLTNNINSALKEGIYIDPGTGKASKQVSPGNYSLTVRAKINGWDYAESYPASFTIAAGETRNISITMHRLPNAIVLSIYKGAFFFDPVPDGYSPPPSKTIDVFSFGVNTPNSMTVAFLNLADFNVTPATLTGFIQDGTGVSFTIEPDPSLPVGTYTDTVEIKSGAAILASFDVSFSVMADVTVTFNTNGGSTVTPITIPYGDTIPISPLSTTSAGGATLNRFRGWYKDDVTFADEFIFDNPGIGTPVTADITLYADWGYRPGDTGPGDGKIFYRDDSGFILPSPFFGGYYLEAAPNNLATLAWASPGNEGIAIGGTSDVLGSGMQNTSTILGIDSAAPAASACDTYTNNGQTDWFLPSLFELKLLYDNKAIVGILNYSYWSSWEAGPGSAWAYNFSSGDPIEILKGNMAYVRAIRAF